MAIGPVILISGIGLLLLSMTNRLGKLIDRTWELAHEIRGLAMPDHVRGSQLTILMRRARLSRAGIATGAVSALLAAILIIALFVGALLRLPLTEWVVAGLFIACMTCLIASLVLFICEINVSLRALALELDGMI